MSGNPFKNLSKDERLWFFVDIMLLLAIIGLSVYLLIFAKYYSKPYSAARTKFHRRPPIENLHSYSTYTIQLPTQKRGGFIFQCTGSLISKHCILTSSPCGKNVQYVEFKGEKYSVEVTYETELHPTQFKNFSLIEAADLQMTILKISGNLQAAGLSVFKLPSLNYQVIYRSSGNMLYEKNERTQVLTIHFVHPYYCDLVYEKLMHIVDFNLMICGISEQENKRKSGMKICMKSAIGGPILQNGVMIGVLSLSMMDTCGEPKRPFVFLNVIPFLQWFNAHNVQYV